MKNKTKLALLSISSVLFIAGCQCNARYSVECTEGFSVENVGYARIENGVMRWRDNQYRGVTSEYKMNLGESCRISTH